MQNVLRNLALVVLIAGCQTEGDSSLDAADSASGGSFRIKAGDISNLYNNSIDQDAANSVITVESRNNSGNDDGRVVMTFDISSLSDVSVSDATLDVFYNTMSSATLVSRLGSIRAYWIGDDCTIGLGNWSDVGQEIGVIVSTNAQLSGLTQKDKISINIASSLQSAVSSSHSCFSVMLRADSEPNSDNDIFTMYGFYNSTVLDAYIPSINGAF